MTIREVTVLVTEKCNFNCTYCYQWSKTGKDIDPLLAKKGIQYAFDNSPDELTITFSGGEPLLSYPLVEKCIYYLKKKGLEQNKNIHFALITNGSLIDDTVLEFLNKNHFEVHFSFDVYLKDQPGELDKFKVGKTVLRKLIKSLDIQLSTNTVFTPETVNEIFDSVQFLHKEGIKQVGISLDQTSYWDNRSLQIFRQQLEKTEDLVISEYHKSGKIIVDYFDIREPSGINTCGAAGERMTIAPDGSLWGCPAFYFLDWEKTVEPIDDYRYGYVQDLENGYLEEQLITVKSHYKKLKTDNFRTDNRKCFLCDHLQECRLCPAQKYSFIKSNRSIWNIPDNVCEINRIIANQNRHFRNQIKKRES